MKIVTFDNNQGYRLDNPDESTEIFLREISSKSLKELYTAERIFCMPRELDAELMDDSHIIDYHADGRIVTGNIVGILGNGTDSLSITSRFDREGKFFYLQYMLTRVLGLSITDYQTQQGEETLFNLLPFFIPYFLNRALAQGIYRPYTNRRYNNTELRGRVDIAEHLRRNIPFLGAVATCVRERNSDNSLTQLIRHTIEYLNELPEYRRILTADRDVIGNVKLVRALTPGYSRVERAKIVRDNLRVIVHPYYTAYTALQQLCLMILTHKKNSYGGSGRPLYGLLIDASWLWEEYLVKVLSETVEGLIHPNNRRGSEPIYISHHRYAEDGAEIIGEKFGPRYPDIYTPQGVMDAKYKREIKREDIHQVITYLHIMDKRYGVLISPVNGDDFRKESFRINGQGGDLHICQMRIPSGSKSYRDFLAAMKESERELQDLIQKYENCS